MSLFSSRAIRTARLFAVLLIVYSGVSLSATSDYPAKPVRLVVGTAAGANADIVARAIATPLTELLGQQVIVDNRSGAAGNLAAEVTARSSADGYTLLFGTQSLAINANLYRQLNYDALRDLAPVAAVAALPFVLVVNMSVPVQNARDFIALARSKPGQFSYSSSGAGSSQHLCAELFSQLAKIKLVHVPYKTNIEALSAVIRGEVSSCFSGIPETDKLVRSGKVRALGVTSSTRHPSLPDVPALAEVLPGFECYAWYGIFAPAGTPAQIITRLNAEIGRVLQRPDMKERLTLMGSIATRDNTPQAVGTMLRNDIAKWGQVIKAAGIPRD